MMYTSLQTIAQMPDHTAIYCAHEYTLDNARFAHSLEPGNPVLSKRLAAMESKRAQGMATIPTDLAQERASNPFLRCMSAEIRRNLSLSEDAGEIATFSAIRRAKDAW
jgi:hydroxyacylglutathione hydrolase